MKKILVVGGAGEIGSFVCSELCKQSKTQIICVDNLSSGDIINVEDLINVNNFKFLNIDFSRYQPWKTIDNELNSRMKFSAIYYLASTNNVSEMYSSHLLGVNNALEMASHHKCRLTLISVPYSRKKHSETSSVGAYYYTKKAGEAIALAYKDKYRIKLSIIQLTTNSKPLDLAKQILWGSK